MVAGIDVTRLFFVLFGLFFVSLSGWGCRLSFLRLCPKTEGIVTRVQVDEVRRTSDAEPTFIPCVTYRYMLAGRCYENDSYWAGRRVYTTLASATSAIGRLEPGSHVSVFYNPKNPHDAVVDTFDFWSIWATWLYIIIWTAFPTFAGLDDVPLATKFVAPSAWLVVLVAPFLAVTIRLIVLYRRSPRKIA